MTENDKNKLIGIKFRLNRRDFNACDCVGIVYLYYKYILGKPFPFTDGKRVFFRDKSKDVERMKEVLDKIGDEINFKDLIGGDVVILKTNGSLGALGVCINERQLLHMDKIVGSCLTKLHYVKDIFLHGYRIKNEQN